MMNNTYPILEFDPAQEAVIEPKRVPLAKDVPAHAALCFFQDVRRACFR